MSATYAVNVRVNMTIEYRDRQEPADVKEDAEAMLSRFDETIIGAHGWVCEVLSVSRPSLIEDTEGGTT